MFLINYLFSSSVTFRRDYFIQFNRIAILALQYSIVLHIISLFMCNKGISLHGGLLHISNITQIFQIFIFFISILILQLTSFYPRKVWISKINLNILWWLDKKIIDKTAEQFKIIEYPRYGTSLTIKNKTYCFLQLNTSLIANSIRGNNLKNYCLNNFNLCIKKRFYSQAFISTNNPKLPGDKINSNLSLNPWLLTGFTDGDGSFTILASKNIRGKLLCKVQPLFTFGLHKKDLPLLLIIQKYFQGVGKIYTRKSDGTVYYNISSIKDIVKYVIPHFDSYPLVSQKKADYLLFREIIMLMSKKEHLSNSGLTKIISLKASLNLGLKGEVADLFANIEPAVRPEVKALRVEDLNPYWVSGFISAEGCFNVLLYKNAKYKAGYTASLRFILTQKNRDSELISLIRDFFESGNIIWSDRDNAVELRIVEFQALKTILVPFLDKYSLIGAKTLEYNDFKLILKLMENKIHLTKEGYDQIKVIKDGMNTKRK